MEHPQYLKLDDLIIEYFIYGTGKKVLLTLHGFGRDYQDFKFFNQELRNYKVIGINLFFHGNSIFPKEKVKNNPLSKTQWVSLISMLIEKEKINTFSLLSYSMGGKFAFCLLESFSERIYKAAFLAPDGIVINPWYTLATKTQTGKLLSKSFGKSDFGIPKVLKVTTALNLTKPSLQKFVEYNTSSKEKREKIYWIWQAFRSIKPDHKIISENLKQVQMAILVVLGERDVAIKKSCKKALFKKYQERITVKVLPLGHNLFKESTKPEIENFIQ